MAEAEGGDNTKRYSPCLRCTQTCYRTHGLGNFSGSCFFKVMLHDFRQKLKLPPKFVNQIKGHMSPDVILEGPSGQLWHAELCCVGTVMTIEHGWKNFVSDHAIEYGDFLVFKHCGNSHFIVQIFGRTGCEKQSAFTIKCIESILEDQILNPGEHDKMKKISFPSFVENSLSASTKQNMEKHCTNTMDSAMPCTKTPDQKMQSTASRKRSYCFSPSVPVSNAARTECAKMLRTGTSVKYAPTLKQTLSYYNKIEKHEVKTEGIQDFVFQAAIGRGSQMAIRVKEVMDKIRRPCFDLAVKKSHVCPFFRIVVPSDFKRRYLPEDGAEGTLLGPDKLQWLVIFPGEDALSPFLRGWREFAVHYNVKLQDICIFELVNKQLLTFEVHIVRILRGPGKKKGCAGKIEYQSPKIEDCKYSSQTIQDIIKVERDFFRDLKVISHKAGYQRELTNHGKCNGKHLNGEDQKPYSLRGDFRRDLNGPKSAGSFKTQNIPPSNIIVLE